MAVSTDSQENRDPLLTDDAQATREPHETRLDDDLTLLTETLEEVLKSSGDPTDQKYIELKAKAEQALHDVKARVSAASDSYYYRAKSGLPRRRLRARKTVAGHRHRRSRRSGFRPAAGAPLNFPRLTSPAARRGAGLFYRCNPFAFLIHAHATLDKPPGQTAVELSCVNILRW